MAAPAQPNDRRPLITFALPEEAAPYRRRLAGRDLAEILLTGIGWVNARQSVVTALRVRRPSYVLTCGFAGGLDPALKRSELVYRAAPAFPNASRLEALGARRVRFHSSDRVVVTAEEKALLRRQTRADAVEMESEAIQDICGGEGIPAATVRVISDAAGEDMPMDFNRFLRPDRSLALGPLVFEVARSPMLIPRLLVFRRQTNTAARRLADLLAGFTGC